MTLRRRFFFVLTLDVLVDLVAAVTTTVALERRGLSAGWILLAIGFWGVIEAFSEIPTGVVADKSGRSPSVTISFLLRGVGGMVLWLMAGTASVFVAFALLAIGATFASGALVAWGVENATEEDGDIDKFFGLVGSFELGAMFLGYVLGGILGATDIDAPFAATAIIGVVSGLLTIVLLWPPENAKRAARRESSIRPPTVRSILRDTWGTIFDGGPAGRLVITLGTVTGLMMVPGSQWAAHLVGDGDDFVSSGLTRGVGGLVGALVLAKLASSILAPRNRRLTLIAAGAIAVLTLTAAGLAGPVASRLPFLIYVVAAMVARSVLGAALNELLEDNVRATVLSTVSLLAAALGGVGVAVVALFVDMVGETNRSWPITAALLAIALLLVVPTLEAHGSSRQVGLSD